MGTGALVHCAGYLHIRETRSAGTVEVKGFVTGVALYLNDAAVRAYFGKPWLELKLTSLKGTPLASLQPMVQEAETNAYGHQTLLFSVAKNAHVVGTQTVDHVRTTEYAGSFTVSAALAALPPATRKFMASVNQVPGNSVITFRTWLDAQHRVRKIIDVTTFNGSTVNTTVTYSSIDQPVTITLPPASQTVFYDKI